jgi:hypothetical protein
MDEELTGAEVQEVADPEAAAAESENNQEAAAPGATEEQKKGTGGETDAAPARDLERDAAFAQLRRELEQQRQTASQIEQEKNRAIEALSYFFPGDNPVVAAKAHYFQKPPDVIQKEMEAQSRAQSLEKENQSLRQVLINSQVQAAMNRDLAEIQKIDPGVKSLDSLGESFLSLMATGKVSAADAYYATQARKEKEAKNPPPVVGPVNTGQKEKDFFSAAEVRGMTPDEVRRNLDKINKSMSKWK